MALSACVPRDFLLKSSNCTFLMRITDNVVVVSNGATCYSSFPRVNEMSWISSVRLGDVSFKASTVSRIP
jgi:hypothetical protein